MRKFLLGALAGMLSGGSAYTQVPEILTVLPSAARTGETVTIRGQEFDAVATNNIVYLGGVRAEVLRGSVAELLVQVPRGIQGGAATVTVRGLTAISSVPFQPLFAPFGPFQAGTNLVFARRSTGIDASGAITLADMDGDGDAEILAGVNLGIQVYVCEGRATLVSTNSFRQAANLSLGLQPSVIEAVDLDSDGRLDILARVPQASEIWFFRNIHSGGELNSESFAAPVRDARFALGAVHVADVDRDGRMDVAAVDSSGRVVVFKTFYDSWITNQILGERLILASEPAVDLAVGDLNRDGSVELIAAGESGLSIFSHNDQRGRFETNGFVKIAVSGEDFSAIRVADVQGDGFLDIVTLSRSSRTIVVLWNRTDGGTLRREDFESVPQIQILAGAGSSPTLLDLDGDALVDLLPGPGYSLANQSAFVKDDMIFWGTFAASNRFLPFSDSTYFRTGDVNADGALDILVRGGGSITVYQNVSGLQPRVEEIGRRPFRLRIAGEVNTTVALQGSTDLKEWKDVQSARIDTAGEATFFPSIQGKAIFFRVMK